VRDWSSATVRLDGGLIHVAVTRLRTYRDRDQQRGIERLRDQVLDASDLPVDLASRLAQILGRELSARNGWRFVMVEPGLNSEVLNYLTEHSARPLKAVRVWGNLFRHLPPDSNEVMADRETLALESRCRPQEVSTIMRELAGIGAVECRRAGRFVRYFVNPRLGTHLGGAARDRAQSEAPVLRLVTDPA